MDIRGQASIVAGGASGLGAATAAALSNAGSKVAILDIDLDLAEVTAKAVGGVALSCDVTDPVGAEAA